MRDSNGNAGFSSDAHHQSAKQIDMAVNDVERTVLFQNATEPSAIGNTVRRPGAWINRSSQGADLFVIAAGFFCMDEKIELISTAVDFTKNIHQPGLNTSSIHPADNVKNSARHIKDETGLNAGVVIRRLRAFM